MQYHTVMIFERESDRLFSGPDIVGSAFVKHNGSALALHTREHTGYVDIAVDIETTAPAIDHDEWDDIVEVGFCAAFDEILVGGFTDVMQLPSTCPDGRKIGRVRIAGRGGDPENYLIQMWPGTGEQFIVGKQS